MLQKFRFYQIFGQEKIKSHSKFLLKYFTIFSVIGFAISLVVFESSNILNEPLAYIFGTSSILSMVMLRISLFLRLGENSTEKTVVRIIRFVGEFLMTIIIAMFTLLVIFVVLGMLVYGITILFDIAENNIISKVLRFLLVSLSFIFTLIGSITTMPILYASEREKIDQYVTKIDKYEDNINLAIDNIEKQDDNELDKKINKFDYLVEKREEMFDLTFDDQFEDIMMKRLHNLEEKINSTVRSEREQIIEEYYDSDKNTNLQNKIIIIKYIKQLENNFDFEYDREYELQSIFDDSESFISIIDNLTDECYDHIDSNEFDDAHQKRNQIKELVSLIDESEKPDKVNQIEEDIVRSEVEYYRDIAEQSLSSENYSECKKYTNQAEKSVETSDIPDQSKEELINDLDGLRERVNEQELRSDILAYQSKIIELLGEDIGDDLFEPDDQIRFKYKKISEIAEIFDRISYDRLDTESWDKFKQAQTRHVSEITLDEIENSIEVIYETKKILSYLETVDSSHPSIDVDSWEYSMETALEEQYPDILTPIISQIDRLQDSLWKKHHLYQMSWEEFEGLIGSLYDSLGYTTTVTQGTADMGVDVWVKNDEERVAIQVKQFSPGNVVGREPLQKTVSTIAKGDADETVVVTSSQFARTAEEYANAFGSGLELISGDDLIEMLTESDIPPPVSQNEETSSKSNINHEGTPDNSSTQIGSPTKNWDEYDKYSYDRYNDATDDIEELKRKREHDKAEKLLLWCINFAEAEAKPNQRDHPRWYYKHLAIIYRKENRYDDELSILQRYVSFCNSMNIEPREEITNRLEKAKQLAAE